VWIEHVGFDGRGCFGPTLDAAQNTVTLDASVLEAAQVGRAIRGIFA